MARGLRKTTARRQRSSAATAEPLSAGPGEWLWFLDPPFRVTLPGARLDRARKSWVYIGTDLPADLRPFRCQPYSRLRWLEDEANGISGAVPSGAALSGAALSGAALSGAVLSGDVPAEAGSADAGLSGVAPKVPRDIQWSGAAAISRAAAQGWRQFLLSDDVGTGKTITMWLGALEVAASRSVSTILVLVDRPAAITIPHWRNTIAAIGDGGHRVLISSPDQLPKLLARNGRPWARWDVVIADECHLYRHMSTRRTQVFRRVARFNDPHDGAPFVILASATPAQHPAELTYVAPVLAQLRSESTARWSDFGGRLADSGLPIVKNSYGKWGWDQQAASDPALQQSAAGQVRGWLADNDPPLTLHRAAPWGPAPLELMPVELDPAERVAYQTMWSQFRAAIAAIAADAPGAADTPGAAGSRGAGRAAARSGRTAVLRFRQKASLLRVGASVAWVAAQVDAGYQVAVSCEFVGAAAVPLAEGLQAKGIAVARIHGGVAGTGLDLEAERMRFQTGAARVVVFTPSASLSLHANEHLADGALASSATRVGLMHNVRYSGLAGRQILGRTHRDHQVSPWWVSYAEGTVEETIATTMIERFKSTADTAGADSTALARVAELLGVSWLPPDSLVGS